MARHVQQLEWHRGLQVKYSTACAASQSLLTQSWVGTQPTAVLMEPPAVNLLTLIASANRGTADSTYSRKAPSCMLSLCFTSTTDWETAAALLALAASLQTRARVRAAAFRAAADWTAPSNKFHVWASLAGRASQSALALLVAQGATEVDYLMPACVPATHLSRSFATRALRSASSAVSLAMRALSAARRSCWFALLLKLPKGFRPGPPPSDAAMTSAAGWLANAITCQAQSQHTQQRLQTPQSAVELFSSCHTR